MPDAIDEAGVPSRAAEAIWSSVPCACVSRAISAPFSLRSCASVAARSRSWLTLPSTQAGIGVARALQVAAGRRELGGKRVDVLLGAAVGVGLQLLGAASRLRQADVVGLGGSELLPEVAAFGFKLGVGRGELRDGGAVRLGGLHGVRSLVLQRGEVGLRLVRGLLAGDGLRGGVGVFLLQGVDVLLGS